VLAFTMSFNVCVYVCVCVFVLVFTMSFNVWSKVLPLSPLHAFRYANECEFVYLCVCVCVCACVSVCEFVYLCVHSNIPTRGLLLRPYCVRCY
jgi:hypothetical protein